MTLEEESLYTHPPPLPLLANEPGRHPDTWARPPQNNLRLCRGLRPPAWLHMPRVRGEDAQRGEQLPLQETQRPALRQVRSEDSTSPPQGGGAGGVRLKVKHAHPHATNSLLQRVAH